MADQRTPFLMKTGELPVAAALDDDDYVVVEGVDKGARYLRAGLLPGTAGASVPDTPLEGDQLLARDAVTGETIRSVIGGFVAKWLGGVTSEAARPLAGKLGDLANVKDFGAKGDGVTDDTAAIDAAIAWCHSKRVGPASGQPGWSASTTGIFFPPGRYIYSGTGATLTAGGAFVMAAVPGTATIHITTSVYLLTITEYLYSTHISGLGFTGGKGVLRHSYTNVDVSGFHVVEDCTFSNFTECAIGNTSSDMPNWCIRRNVFYGGGTASISVAIGGYLDNCVIEHNAFLRGKYGLKLGDRLSGSFHVLNNDFITFESGVRAADIWIVPNTTDAFGNTSGHGGRFIGNKFGNENMAATDVRVLIAAEAAGTDRLTKQHTTTPNTTNAYVSGLIWRENRIVANSGVTAPFMLSYIHNIRGMQWSDNVHDGSYSHLCEFASGALAANGGEPWADRGWRVDLGVTRDNGRPFTTGITNAGRALVPDHSAQNQPYPEVILPGVGDDASFLSLGKQTGGADLTLFGGSTKTTVNDVYGLATAAEVTCGGASAGSYLDLTASTPLAGRMSWVEVDLKSGAANSLSRVTLRIGNYTTGKSAIFQKVPLTSRWQTVRMPFVFPPQDAGATSWQLLVIPDGNYAAGSTDRFQVARLRVYHAAAPAIGSFKTASGLELTRWVGVPASAAAAGMPGDAAYASGFLYVCVALNTWQRVAIATW